MQLPCGHTAEDDGDRYYSDVCFQCPWKSPYRASRDGENSLISARWAIEKELRETPRRKVRKRIELAARLEQVNEDHERARAVTDSITRARSIETKERLRRREEVQR